MQRRDFLRSVSGSVAATSLTRGNSVLGQSSPVKRPNVVFFLTDEWRAQATGYAGDANARTPTLDGLASEGLNCTNFTSGSALLSSACQAL